jgi:hypothetical protein
MAIKDIQGKMSIMDRLQTSREESHNDSALTKAT